MACCEKRKAGDDDIGAQYEADTIGLALDTIQLPCGCAGAGYRSWNPSPNGSSGSRVKTASPVL